MILLYTNLVHIQYRRMKLFILQKKVKILKIKIEVNFFADITPNVCEPLFQYASIMNANSIDRI